MKKILTNLILAGVCAIAVSLVGCTDNGNDGPKTSASVTVESAEILSATFNVNTSNLTEYAFLVAPVTEAPVVDPVIIFKDGVSGTLVEGENRIVVSGLEANMEYTAVFAFKVSETEFYEEVIPVSFTTTDYVDTFTLIAKYSDGFKLHYIVPKSVKENKHVMRYNIGSLPMYLSNKVGWLAAMDADMLLMNGQHHIMNDTTITYRAFNIYELDENGNEVLDEWTGEPVMLHTPFVPGEPIIFMAGEFGWDDTDFTGWGNGWYTACYDYDAYYESLGGGGWGPLAVDVDDAGSDEDAFWTGEYIRRHFVLDPPAALDANVDIKTEMGAMTGTVTITPDDNVYQYCLLILPEDEYQGMLPFIDNNESYLQWFTTSYVGAMYFNAATLQGPVEIALEDNYYLQPETNYHLLLTAMGDETGATQKFWHEQFATTAKSHPAPVVEVKAIANPSGTESPYEAWLNVKCTSKNAVSARYAANYYREFGMMENSGYTYADIVEQGNYFSADDVAEINSDAGMNVMFSSMPDAVTRLAVLAYNDEETPNDINNDPSAIADYTTIKEPAKAPVESPLFADLLGDWTMSGSVEKYDYYTSAYVPAGTQSCKITITDGVTYPETLDQSVYDTYKSLIGYSKEQVDALYEEFKQEVEEFNAKLRSQNRLLCYGFGFESTPGYFKLNTPFDLFCSDSYNGYDNESMIWDCGPKWYLEINADGTVTLPINQTRFYPLSTMGYYTLYLTGFGSDGYVSVNENGENIDFPVSVSSDNATLTINPFVYNGINYYLNAMYFYGVYGYLPEFKNADVLTLTKGWTEPAEPASAASAPAVKSAANALPAPAVNGMTRSSASVMKRKTALKAMVKHERVVLKPVSTADAIANMRESYAVER